MNRTILGYKSTQNVPTSRVEKWICIEVMIPKLCYLRLFDRKFVDLYPYYKHLKNNYYSISIDFCPEYLSKYKSQFNFHTTYNKKIALSHLFKTVLIVEKPLGTDSLPTIRKVQAGPYLLFLLYHTWKI